MNDSIEYFFLRNLTIGLILRDYFEPQEIPLVLGRIFEQRKLSGWKCRLGGRDQSKRERMKNREKNGEKAQKRKRAKTADGIRCNADPDTLPVKSLFTERPKWPNSNEQSDSDGRQPIIRRRDFDVFRSRIYSPVEHFNRRITNRGKFRPRKRAGPQRDEFCTAVVKSGRRIMRKTWRFASRKILGIFYLMLCRLYLTINCDYYRVFENVNQNDASHNPHFLESFTNAFVNLQIYKVNLLIN